VAGLLDLAVAVGAAGHSMLDGGTGADPPRPQAASKKEGATPT
jgi:hypothetical protein